MPKQEGLIYAYRLDGQGGGQPLDWHALQVTDAMRGVLWVHLYRDDDAAQRWLTEASGVDALVSDALLAEETRPRCTNLDQGVLLNLRGVNLNPDADPEDMVSIRLWIEADCIISVRMRRLLAVEDMHEAIAAGRGPKNVGDFVVDLADKLIERMEPVIGELDDDVDRLEDNVVTSASQDLRGQLASLRRRAILLRRYIAPQREALSRLIAENVDWLDQWQRGRLREVADRVTRYVEDLDAARERAAVIHDELTGRLAEQMNRTMYVLSVVAAIFLPLGLVTGLLGINVGGIPGVDSPWAFAAVTAGLVLFGLIELWLFRRLKWL